METQKSEMTIEQEQDLFDKQLDELVKAHKGKFVLFKGGRPVDFFNTFQEAYADGLRRFGPNAIFLVMPAEKLPAEPVSLSWEAGVMFG